MTFKAAPEVVLLGVSVMDLWANSVHQKNTVISFDGSCQPSRHVPMARPASGTYRSTASFEIRIPQFLAAQTLELRLFRGLPESRTPFGGGLLLGRASHGSVTRAVNDSSRGQGRGLQASCHLFDSAPSLSSRKLSFYDRELRHS